MEQAILKAMIAICSKMTSVAEQAQCYAFLISCTHSESTYSVTMEERKSCFKDWSSNIKD